MNNRTIDIRDYIDILSLKRFILQKLKLIDYKRDSVDEFEDRLKNYLGRNKNLRIVLQFDSDRFEKKVKFDLSVASRATHPYPENFEMGNPFNRWLFDPIVKTEAEIEKEKIELEKGFQDKLERFKSFLATLERLGNGQISIKYG